MDPNNTSSEKKKLSRKKYEKELARLQIELVKLQEWIKFKKLKVVVLFEGRDAAGKGGAIKRITESMNPRVCHVAALGKPSEREESQWYFQRYVPYLPAAGEMVPFRPKLVQLRGRRQGYGLYHPRSVGGVLPHLPRIRKDADPLRDYSCEVLVFRFR